MQFDLKKFSFAELTSNKDGKTSGSGTTGILISICGCVGFIFGTFIKNPEIISNSLMMTTIGASLLGYRKYSDSKDQSSPSESSDSSNN